MVMQGKFKDKSKVGTYFQVILALLQFVLKQTFLYLSGPLPYIRRHITVNKMC